MGGKTGPQAVAAVADVYLGFAAAHPSLYEAMFQLPIDARFAQDDAETELRSGFDARRPHRNRREPRASLERAARRAGRGGGPGPAVPSTPSCTASGASDHVLVATPTRNPVLIDIEDLMYFDVEWEATWSVMTRRHASL